MSEGLGEFGRISRFFAPLAGPGGLGLKDDAALVECAAGHRLVVTVDQAIESVHFLPADPPELVAKKLLRRNLSDLAAMGATPKHYLVTTALPADRGDQWVEDFAKGLGEDQAQYGIDLLGGDSSSTRGPAVLTITAIGEVAAGAEIRRSGAQPGDRIWVSGTIGDAYLGLKVLRGEFPGLAPDYREALIARFQLPQPRTALGSWLARVVHAMCDVSDGLVADLGHICDASGVGAVVTLPVLPLSAAAGTLVLAEGVIDVASLATGGDDYELLFTAPPEADQGIAAISGVLQLRVTAIGSIERGAGVRLVDAAGNPVPVARPGWRHF